MLIKMLRVYGINPLATLGPSACKILLYYTNQLTIEMCEMVHTVVVFEEDFGLCCRFK